MEEIMTLAIDIGKSMIKCGAEINRVEETIIRICSAYGIDETEVFSMVSLISVTARDKENSTAVTQTRRVYNYSANFHKLNMLNSLSRDICNKKINLEQGRKKLKEIKEETKKFHVTVLIGSIIATAAFAIFFGGDWKDAISAGIIAIPVYFINTFIHHRRINRLVYTAFNSCVAGTLAITFCRFGLGSNYSMIMIGDIMLLIPGLMFINAFREFFCGDIISGATRMLDCLAVAAAIACGFAIPILTFSYIGWC